MTQKLGRWRESFEDLNLMHAFSLLPLRLCESHRLNTWTTQVNFELMNTISNIPVYESHFVNVVQGQNHISDDVRYHIFSQTVWTIPVKQISGWTCIAQFKSQMDWQIHTEHNKYEISTTTRIELITWQVRRVKYIVKYIKIWVVLTYVLHECDVNFSVKSRKKS